MSKLFTSFPAKLRANELAKVMFCRGFLRGFGKANSMNRESAATYIQKVRLCYKRRPNVRSPAKDRGENIRLLARNPIPLTEKA